MSAGRRDELPANFLVPAAPVADDVCRGYAPQVGRAEVAGTEFKKMEPTSTLYHPEVEVVSLHVVMGDVCEMTVMVGSVY